MPAATTHVQFAEDVYALLPQQFQKRITDFPLFWLGSQGPDMLLFSKASLLPGSLKKYGGLLHHDKPWEVISFFREKMEEDPVMCSYYYGYLCHYALDSCAHPLVWAISQEEHERTHVRAGEIHVRLEAELDVWIMNQRGHDIQEYDVYKKMRISRPNAKKLAGIFEEMFRTVFNIEVPAEKIVQSINDTWLMTRILKPSSQLKYNVIRKAEDLLHLPHPASSMMLIGKHDQKILNLNHIAYPLKYDPEKTISASLPELYGKAVWLAKKIITDLNSNDITVNFNGEPVTQE